MICEKCGYTGIGLDTWKTPDGQYNESYYKLRSDLVQCPECSNVQEREDEVVEETHDELQELREFREKIKEFTRQLGTMKWIGADEGWDLAVDKVKEELEKILKCLE